MRKLKTNKTQILHRIRLKKFVPNQPLEDSYQNEKLQEDEDIVIPQDDLYTISWETDFGRQISDLADNVSTNVSARPQQSEAETSSETATTRIRVESDTAHTRYNDVTDKSARPHTKERNDDVMTDSNRKKENERVPDFSNQRQQNEEVLNEECSSKKNEKITEKTAASSNSSADNNSNAGGDITVPGISENDKNDANENKENASPRGGKYNLRPNPTPNFTEEYRY